LKSLFICCALLLSAPLSADSVKQQYLWHRGLNYQRIVDRIPAPSGYRRIEVPGKSFSAWLRGLPVLPGRPRVRLHNGKLKGNQSAHHVVVSIDVGRRDLQQCADAVMRLRAEYLFANACRDSIAFKYTSGDVATWRAWQRGVRPRIRGNKVSWVRRAHRDGGYQNFRRYLDKVFTYAGSYSLSRELLKVRDPAQVRIGDVFIRGGFPGHAVIVVDVAENRQGRRIFLLAQSFMPAQQIHVLRNPTSSLTPWYSAKQHGPLVTPEWLFHYRELKRFARISICP
jgi:Domain of unknown function (4846)